VEASTLRGFWRYRRGCGRPGTAGFGCRNRAWSTPGLKLTTVRDVAGLTLGVKLGGSHVGLDEQAPVIDDDADGILGTQALISLLLFGFSRTLDDGTS